MERMFLREEVGGVSVRLRWALGAPLTVAEGKAGNTAHLAGKSSDRQGQLSLLVVSIFL